MEGTTSTPNGGSKNRVGYSEAKTKNVSESKIDKLYEENGYGSFDINCMAFSCYNNVKSKGGEEITEASSYATLEFDNGIILKDSVVVSLRNVTPENYNKIKKRRDKEKEKRERIQAEKLESKDEIDDQK